MEPVSVKRVLAAIDFSDWTVPVLQTAKDVALRYGAGITTIHAERFLPPPYFTAGGIQKLSEALKGERQAAENYLSEIVRRELGEAHGQDRRLVEAFPAEAILRTAHEVSADLIVMGTHGRRGFNKLLLGSVAENVLQSSTIPVMTIRGVLDAAAVEHIPFRRVLCPVNDRPVAREALRYAADIALRFETQLIVMTALETKDLPASESRSELQENLCGAVPQPVRAHCAVQGLVRSGEAAVEILGAAKEHGIDLIVIGAQHRPFFDSKVLGTTSVRVMRHAPCPVLTISRVQE